MPYQKIRGNTPEEYRQIFIDTYCNPSKPIYTFDKILVKFYPDMFDHTFYESDNWKKKDKSLFSYNRAEKILWIKDALEDSTAILKVRYNSKTKTNDHSRRVAIVKNDFIVIIWMKNNKEAKFITAFQAYDSIDKIIQGPDWKGLK